MAAFFYVKKSNITTVNGLRDTETFPVKEGTVYFTKDHFVVYDYKDTEDNDKLKRAVINAAHADTAGVADDVTPSFFDTHFETVDGTLINTYSPPEHSYDAGLLTIKESALTYHQVSASKVKPISNS